MCSSSMGSMESWVEIRDTVAGLAAGLDPSRLPVAEAARLLPVLTATRNVLAAVEAQLAVSAITRAPSGRSARCAGEESEASSPGPSRSDEPPPATTRVAPPGSIRVTVPADDDVA